MSDMTDERMIEVLRKEGREYRQEIKGLKDMEDFRISTIKTLRENNSYYIDKVLKLEQNNELLFGAVIQSEIEFRKLRHKEMAQLLTVVIRKAKGKEIIVT